MSQPPVPAFPQFARQARTAAVVPVYREIQADTETPVSTYLKVAAGEPYAYLLESVEGGERWARYSFIAGAPKLVFKSRGKRFSVAAPDAAERWKTTDDPLAELQRLLAARRAAQSPGLPPFWGGAVGYAAYDTVRFIERLPNRPPDDVGLPDMLFLFTDLLVVFDHLSHTVKVIKCVETRGVDLRRRYAAAVAEIDALIARLRAPLRDPAAPCRGHGPVRSNRTRSAFCASVRQAKEHIRAGDIIQVVLSQRFTRPTRAEPFAVYRALRRINPSPYMYHIAAGDFAVVGSSPEILVRKEGDRAETRPIAGTRPRPADAARETQVAQELLRDPKERAEHIMLVDLGRNDLGRVCRPASVSVPELMRIEKFSHVMHIVSSVTGTLRPDVDAFDLFRACFPAGTVSGAPKVRAMQIIDELEPTARGPYAGAVGYFAYAGDMDMAITIRTVIVKDGTATVQAGAGIVADSVPAREWQETRNKAAALLAAIDRAEDGTDA